MRTKLKTLGAVLISPDTYGGLLFRLVFLGIIARILIFLGVTR